MIALREGIALGLSLVMRAAHRLGIDVVRSAGMVGDDDDDVVANLGIATGHHDVALVATVLVKTLDTHDTIAQSADL